MIKRIHIVGASGSGTTTLAQELNYKHFDTDDFFWVKMHLPYQQKTQIEERIRYMSENLNNSERWILSGSLCG